MEEISHRPNFNDIELAAERLHQVALTTPLLESTLLNQQLGMRLLIKAENLQRTGSFKFRGAYNKLKRHLDTFRKTGIVAYSGGNHAQGAAAAAAMLGIDAIILMPSDAPPIKIEQTRAYGAKVQLHDRWDDDRDAIATDIIAKSGRVLVPSFDDFDIIAGQGTVGLEIAAQCAAAGIVPDVLLLCCGGGGLCAGASLAAKELMKTTQVFAVEPEDFDDTKRSLISGKRENNHRGSASICDALLTQCGVMTLEMNRKTLDGVLTVSDHQTMTAMRTLFSAFKIVAEPGGAVAAASAIHFAASGQINLSGKTVVAVVTGGNVEPQRFADALMAKD
ncbi:MAG: threonine/serine dehydratase [Pseudomonadota bacterium]